MFDHHHSQGKAHPRRIILIWLVVPSLLVTACGGGSQTYTVGVINLAPDLDSTVAGFKEGMTELGYIDCENITYAYEGSADSIEKLDKAAQGLVEADVNCPPQDPILGYWRVLAH